MRFGRLPPYPENVKPRLRLTPYLRLDQIPPTPRVVDYMSRVTQWPMYRNDEIGCCTCAAAGHMIQGWTTYGQGHTVTISDDDVIAAYSAISGYDPRDPSTDQGAVMQDALNHWRKNGIGGRRILAFAQLDHRDHDEVTAALHLFGHIYVGALITREAMTQFERRQPWDVGRRSSPILGGHAFAVGFAADGSTYQCATWGTTQKLTRRWWDAYVEEAWVAISPDWISTAGTTPPGLDVQALGAAFTILTGEPSPFPAPAPVPGPAVDEADRALAEAMRAWMHAKGL